MSTRPRVTLSRVALALAVAAAAFPAAARSSTTSSSPGAAPADDLLVEATHAAVWLRAVSVKTELGRLWPGDPVGSRYAGSDLYHGAAGVVWFLLALAQETGSAAWRQQASEGADYLVAATAGTLTPERCGLYSGASGVAAVLLDASDVLGEDRFRAASSRLVDGVLAAAGEREGGIGWGDSTDIISGAAGIGLFLLDAADRLGRDDALDAAHRAATALVARARTSEHGRWWPMNDAYPRVMPNFSHGTAGVSFFLARAAAATGDDALLEAAIAGANHLIATAESAAALVAAATDDDPDLAPTAAAAARGCLVPHHTPGGESLFYLGWCHGPAGTGRLFLELARVTGDPTWRVHARRGAEGILALGAPAARSAGYWNNVSVCCGDAGVGSFFLDLYRAEGRAEDLAVAEAVAAGLAAAAERDGAAARWPQAENRVRPEQVAAQTGYMQGAAGIGRMFLELRAARDGRALSGLPDRVIAPGG